MTVDDLYDDLEIVARDLVADCILGEDTQLHAANVVLCSLMNALDEALEGNPALLLELALIVGAHDG